VKHFICLEDIREDVFHQLIDLAVSLKKKQKKGKFKPLLTHKVLGMIFEKPSLRTRQSFEVGMTQLGGSSIYIAGNEIQMGEREPLKDIARTLSRYLDLVMIRAFEHETITEFAEYATVPVINGLSNYDHPCQAMADLLTIYEHKGTFDNVRVAYIGDGNNVARSLGRACKLAGCEFVVSCPKGYELSSTSFVHYGDPFKAVENADVIYTDVWVSMGDEKEEKKRLKDFASYQVNSELMKAANPDAIFMHCLPAIRGQEVTDEVMESSQSVVFDQAENRLHAQKAVLAYLGGS
jgi:ornithine carbamoyltransferase